jgi:DNA-binding transcriptional regulator GbsR (MarR family)
MSAKAKASPAELQTLAAARDEFITQWGSMGSAWGINRTMAQLHAMLLTATSPLTTDEIMEELKISRGNANMNLRELCGWGLIRSVIRKGERKKKTSGRCSASSFANANAARSGPPSTC